MRVAIYTLGCKVNQYETQAMERELTARGHQVVDFAAEADAYVVNTCSVTAVSDQKSRQVIHRVQRDHPGAVVAVCGCYPQTHADDVRKLGVDLMAGTGDRTGFLHLLEEAVTEKRRIEAIDQPFERRVFEVLPAGGLPERTRAMLKVEDGCANFCSYCIIPYARGRVRSLPIPTAAEQTRQLAAEGYREIVVTGIEISSWGRDLKTGESLIDLLEAVCAAAPDLRFRLGSLEPRTVTEDFCRRASALPNLCPQFHLSLQSGCDETLRRMNRKYDTARFAQSVDLLNQYFEHPAITTDLITGFPEETEEEFARTLDFIRRCPRHPGGQDAPGAQGREGGAGPPGGGDRGGAAPDLSGGVRGGGVPRPVRAAQGGQIRRPRAQLHGGAGRRHRPAQPGAEREDHRQRRDVPAGGAFGGLT